MGFLIIFRRSNRKCYLDKMFYINVYLLFNMISIPLRIVYLYYVLFIAHLSSIFCRNWPTPDRKIDIYRNFYKMSKYLWIYSFRFIKRCFFFLYFDKKEIIYIFLKKKLNQNFFNRLLSEIDLTAKWRYRYILHEECSIII